MLFSFARLSAVSLRTNGFMLTTPRDTQGGALNFVRIMNYTPKFRPLLSSFCSLYLPPAALANEPWRAAARENRSTLTSKASCFRKVLFLLPFLYLSQTFWRFIKHWWFVRCRSVHEFFLQYTLLEVPYFLQISLKYFLYVFIILSIYTCYRIINEHNK